MTDPALACLEVSSIARGVMLLDVIVKLLPNPTESNPPDFLNGEGRNAVPMHAEPDPDKHVLALVHRGGGTTAQLLEVAREVRDGVHDRLGISLVPEPVLVGAQL